MRTARKALLPLAVGVSLVALAGPAIAAAPLGEGGPPLVVPYPGATYPWVQPPAWVVTAPAPALPPGAAYEWVQPPAWVPIA